MLFVIIVHLLKSAV